MSRWSNKQKDRIDDTPRTDAFIEDILAVCRKHKLWISHEDGHGAFEITGDEEDSDYLERWLRCATTDVE